MSASLFYRENQKIAHRVAQLVDDIVATQGNIVELDDDLRVMQDQTLQKLRTYVKQIGISSVDEAKAHIASIVPKDFMDKLNTSLAQTKDTPNGTAASVIEKIVYATTVISKARSVAALVEALQVCSAMDVMRDILTAFRLMTNARTFQEGYTFLKSLPETIQGLSKIWEVEKEGTMVMSAIEAVQTASEMAEALGEALDVVLVIIAAVEGQEQKDDLVKALNNLYSSRIVTQQILSQAQIPLAWESYVSSITTILQYTNDASAAASAVDALEQSVLARMGVQKTNASFDSVYKSLKALDDQRKAYEDYDPSYSRAKIYVDGMTSQTGGSSDLNIVATPQAPVLSANNIQAKVDQSHRLMGLHQVSITASPVPVTNSRGAETTTNWGMAGSVLGGGSSRRITGASSKENQVAASSNTTQPPTAFTAPKGMHAMAAFGWGDITGAISNAGNTIAGGAAAAGGAIAGGATDVGHAIAGGATDAGHVIAGGATDAGHAIADGANQAIDAAKGGLYPDNPKREHRVDELIDDLRYMQTQLNDTKNTMRQIGNTLRPNLDACMKALGLTSFADIEAAIMSKCSPADVAQWKAAREQMEKDQEIENDVFGVVDIIAATIGVVGIVLTFAVPPVGAALDTVALTLGIVSVVVQTIVNIVQGDVIRDKCRDAMSHLIPARISARVAYDKMFIMQEWFKSINTTMNAFEVTMNRDQAADLVKKIHLISDGMVVKYALVNDATAKDQLSQLDTSRNSWTNEG